MWSHFSSGKAKKIGNTPLQGDMIEESLPCEGIVYLTVFQEYDELE